MKSDRLRRESEHLVAFQHACPFNNFSDVRAVAGHMLAEPYGGTCLLQSARLRERLRNAFDDSITFDLHGSHPRYAEGHVAVVSRKEGGAAHLIDPTVLVLGAIPITSTATAGSSPPFRILPLGGSAKPRWLQVCGHAQSEILTERILSGPEYTPVDAYPLRLQSPLLEIDPHDPWDTKMASEPRSRLMLHVTDTDFNVRTIQMDIAEEVRWAGRIGGKGMFDRPDQRLDFEKEVEIIARQIGVTTQELIGVFDETHTLYSQIHPKVRRRKRPNEG